MCICLQNKAHAAKLHSLHLHACTLFATLLLNDTEEPTTSAQCLTSFQIFKEVIYPKLISIFSISIFYIFILYILLHSFSVVGYCTLLVLVFFVVVFPSFKRIPHSKLDN